KAGERRSALRSARAAVLRIVLQVKAVIHGPVTVVVLGVAGLERGNDFAHALLASVDARQRSGLAGRGVFGAGEPGVAACRRDVVDDDVAVIVDPVAHFRTGGLAADPWLSANARRANPVASSALGVGGARVLGILRQTDQTPASESNDSCGE